MFVWFDDIGCIIGGVGPVGYPRKVCITDDISRSNRVGYMRSNNKQLLQDAESAQQLGDIWATCDHSVHQSSSIENSKGDSHK